MTSSHLPSSGPSLPRNAMLLRIYLGESEKDGHQPLYESLVLTARENGLAGATVLRGPMGFGHSGHLHTSKILRLSEDLPLVIEIVDVEEKLRAFLATVSDRLGSTLVTLETVQVVQYGPHHP